MDFKPDLKNNNRANFYASVNKFNFPLKKIHYNASSPEGKKK